MIETEKDVERFVVRKTKEDHHYLYSDVERAEFVRCDGLCFSGTTEELILAIADAEELPPEFIHSQGKGYGFNIYSDGNLPAVMEWTKRTGQHLSYRPDSGTLKSLKKDSGKKVVCISHGHYVIDGQWSLDGHSLYYDPDGCRESLAHREHLLAFEKKNSPQKIKIKRSKIPWRGVLGTMSNCLFYKIDALKLFNRDYPGYRSWRRKGLLKLHTPDSREQAAWSIPKMAEIFWLLTRTKNYRTAEFLAAAKLAATKYVNDPLMTPELKAFVLEESRARVNVKKEGTQ